MKAAVLPGEDGKGGWHCTYAKAFLNIRYIQHQLGCSRRINIHELHLHHGFFCFKGSGVAGRTASGCLLVDCLWMKRAAYMDLYSSFSWKVGSYQR